MSEEIWRPVPGYAGIYAVSSRGAVRHVGSPRLRALCAGSRGYFLVSLSRPGDRTPTSYNVHALVAAAFLGPRPEGMDVCHKNGNRLDNRVENLEYGTRIKNIRDKYAHGTTARGSLAGGAKLKEEDVANIRLDYKMGMTMDQLAAEYDVSRGAIRPLVRGASWTHVAPELATPKGLVHNRAKLSREQVLEIRERYAAGGLTHEALAAEYGLDRSAVSDIIRGKTWKDVGGPLQVRGPGEKHGRATITEAQVREIRERYAVGGVSYASLAAEYHTTKNAIAMIVTRKSWKRVA